jgi:hypothetical protein
MRESHAARHRLQELAIPQMGLFTAQEALQCGFSRRSLASGCSRGDFAPAMFNETRLRAVYRLAGAPQDWPAPVLAACLAVGDGAVACRETALQLHGLRRPDPSEVHVCRPARWQPVVPGIVVHTTRDLIAGDWTTVEGVPTTRGARTAIDMAAGMSQAGLFTLLDDLIFGGVDARPWIYRRACALQNGRAGVLEIIRLTGPGAQAQFRSWLERQAGTAYQRFGVAQPAWNVPVNDARGRIGIVDCLWPCGLVVELEGLRFHTTPRQRRDDAARFNRLVRRGRVLRYTWHDVVERPGDMCAEILESLGAVDLAPGR